MQPGKGEVAGDISVLRIETEHALVITDRFLKALELKQRIGAPIQRVGIIGSDPNGSVIARKGISGTPRREQCGASVDLRFKELRLRRQDAVIARYGLVMTAQRGKHIAAIVPGLEECRIDGERGVETNKRVLGPFQCELHCAPIGEGFGKAGFDGKRILEACERLDHAALARQGAALREGRYRRFRNLSWLRGILRNDRGRGGVIEGKASW